ncbi:MAG: hypothetical protein APF78_03875 [Sphingomonadales bacterium BRH_c3]|nr:MAG: hypothetical protein APF78_03875 [Sphingomonadales bacterium BRH_c3]
MHRNELALKDALSFFPTAIAGASILADEITTNSLDRHSKLTTARGGVDPIIHQAKRLNGFCTRFLERNSGMNAKRQAALFHAISIFDGVDFPAGRKDAEAKPRA